MCMCFCVHVHVFVCACVCVCVQLMCLCVQNDFWWKLNHTGYRRKRNLKPSDGCGKKYSCDCDWRHNALSERQRADRTGQTDILRPIGEFCGLGVELVMFWLCRYLALHWLLTVRSPVVTLCTTSLTFNNSTFCPHSVFMCFVWISEQTAIISLYNINWLVFITEI